MTKTPDGPLCLVFIPALVTVLHAAEKQKGAPLTEQEVIDIRNNATCVKLPLSAALDSEQKRGYPDIVAENCWEAWQSMRTQLFS